MKTSDPSPRDTGAMALGSARPLPFANRREAGRRLAAHLQAYANQPDVVVLGVPRGGVPVAFEVATALRAPLDLWVVRKLGLPGQPEYAMGAIATGEVTVHNTELIRRLGLKLSDMAAVTRAELRELHRRERLYRGQRPLPPLEQQRIVLVDDGLATGASMRAAVQALRQHRPRKIIVAVPVGAPEACALLREEADEVVCDLMPQRFNSVGQWYEDFSQTSDGEVRDLLAQSWHRGALAIDSPAFKDAAASDDVGDRTLAPESAYGVLP